MKLPSSAIHEDAAYGMGYRPLTTRFYLPVERTSLDKAMQDLDKGGIDYVLVGVQTACEIWRKNLKHPTNNHNEQPPITLPTQTNGLIAEYSCPQID